MEIPSNWTFKDRSVATGFEAHVREQLPWYELMSGAVAHIARHYIPEHGTMYDLGCSTGNIGRLLEDTIATRDVDFIPVDNSEEMAALYVGPGSPLVHDFSVIEIQPFDVAVLFLSLMFVPVPRREPLLQRLRNQLRPGGAIIIVDKSEAIGGYLGTILARLTLAGKMSEGAPAEEIIAKELSLMGVQRPVNVRQISGVEVFRFGEFAGWVIEG